MPSDKNNPFSSALEAALSKGLGGIVERAELIQALDRQLRQSLPETLAGHCKLANVNNDRLVFLVSSPVWKTRLRLNTDILLDAAAALGLSARDLTIKVAAVPSAESRSAELPPPGTSLSEAARRHLDDAALTVKDPELAAILRRLASLPDPM